MIYNYLRKKIIDIDRKIFKCHCQRPTVSECKNDIYLKNHVHISEMESPIFFKKGHSIIEGTVSSSAEKLVCK